MSLSYRTSGESHGKGLSALVEGFPSGVKIDRSFIDRELQRRQGGYGRGGRQKIESDHVDFLSGVLHEQSTGAPILLWVPNRDYKIETMPELFCPRPGHGDLAGSIKYHTSIRPILERASARETAARVAAGALARSLLDPLSIVVVSTVLSIGSLSLTLPEEERERISPAEWRTRCDASDLYSLVPERDQEGRALIDQCRQNGDTLGGIIEVRIFNVPFGLGSHVQWNRKLDARLAMAAMSVQAIKGVEIGLGFESARRLGSEVHDPILFSRNHKKERSKGFSRGSNHAGGIEAGMSNSEPIVVRAAMKPIATLKKPLASVDLKTGKKMDASYERSDVCAVSAASVVLENVLAFEIAAACLEKFPGDSLPEFLGAIASVFDGSR